MARGRIVKTRVEGLKDCERALRDLPKATARNVVRRVLKAAAQPIADMGRSLAPTDEGHLKASYGVGTKLTRRQRRAHRKQSPIEVFVGPGGDPAAIATEFGNEHQAAQPHLRPAWDANKAGALKSITADLVHEIGKATARAQRKAAREAKRAARGK